MAPIAMLNALWFHDDERRGSYGQYSQAVMPIIDAVGASVLVPPMGVDHTLEGDFDPDLAFFIRYPSSEAFDDMWRSDAYAEMSPLRATALRRAVLTRCAIDPPDAGPVHLDPGIAVLNMLWFQPGGRERYDDYLAAAQPHVEAVGGRYVTPRFVPEQAVEGGFQPDLIFIGSYPSRAALESLITSPGYSRAAELRAEAVQRSLTTTLCVPPEDPS
jgi:uncharacterized protein (DUF1330 family)